MKAISLWQPWASLMAIGVKRNETRPRAFSNHNDLAICAAKLYWRNGVPEYAITALNSLYMNRAKLGTKFEAMNSVKDVYDALPFGAVVCVVTQNGCVATNDDNGDDRSLTPVELQLGDYSPGRFYYPTSNCRPLRVPVAVIGSQGIFTLPPSVELEVIKNLLPPIK